MAVKKYDLCVRDISFAGITIDNKCIYSLHLINESKLQYFDTVEPDWIPNNSLLREFIGGSIYDV